MNVRINIADSVGPRLASLVKQLYGVELQRAAGVEVQQLTATHIGALQRRPDSFSSKFGAPASGFYQAAAEKVASPAALAANANEAVLTINQKGFVRAFRSVRITPTTSKALAIPVLLTAFGHRAKELWDRLGLFIPKGKRVICAIIGGVVTPFYILVGSVTQKQDRSLLPSDDEFQSAAKIGVKGWIQLALAKGGTI